MHITFCHNPRYSKSRAVLPQLKQRQLDFEIIEYLKSPPNSSTLHEILEKLGGSAAQLVRTSEKEYQTLNLAQADKYRLVGRLIKPSRSFDQHRNKEITQPHLKNASHRVICHL